MWKNIFKTKLNNWICQIWTILTLDSTEIAEIIWFSWFDWVFIDMEHSSLDFSKVKNIIQTIDNSCSTLIRIPSNHEYFFKKALDLWCDWVIVPQVNNITEAIDSVNFSKYPPMWKRSVWISRAHSYWLKFNEYINNANNDISLIIQIESFEAVNNLDEILSVKWIDAVFIWPYDLSWSMWILWDMKNKNLIENINLIINKCNKFGIPVWTFFWDIKAIDKNVLSTYDFIATWIDTFSISNMYKKFISTLKNNL